MLVTKASMSPSDNPARATASSATSSSSSKACFWKTSVRSSHVWGLQIPLVRLTRVAIVNAGIGIEPLQTRKLRIDGGGVGEGVRLADLVRRVRGRDREDFDRESEIRLARVLREINREHCHGSFPSVEKGDVPPRRFRPDHH